MTGTGFLFFFVPIDAAQPTVWGRQHRAGTSLSLLWANQFSGLLPPSNHELIINSLIKFYFYYIKLCKLNSASEAQVVLTFNCREFLGRWNCYISST